MENLAFTRYLYSKIEVKQSLFMALIDKVLDEALFWTYELYYSGFEGETLEFLFSIYESIYEKENPQLRSYIETLSNNVADPCSAGSIIATLIRCQYHLADFVSLYLHVKVKDTNKPPIKPIQIRLNPSHIQKYETILPVTRHYLKHACKYATRKEMNQLFNNKMPSFREQYYYKWEYFASRSPFWMRELEKCSATVNHATQLVEFPTGELAESFYETWKIEPDEQSAETQSKSIADNVAQLSIDDFCKRYNIELVKKTILIRKPALTNSIVHT